jgi:excisionase family DNA binding protein
MSLYDRPHGTPRHPRAVTLREAAERLAVTPDTLRQQIAAGRLRAVKHGPVWWVTAAEIERYQREQLGRPGRKSGASPRSRRLPRA